LGVDNATTFVFGLGLEDALQLVAKDMEELRCYEENDEHAAPGASSLVATVVEAEKTATLAPLSVAPAPCDALPSPAV
jgi:hypothetical protein